MIKVSLILALLYFLSSIGLAKMQDQAIYGDDNRVEFYKIQHSAVREVADSTAAIIPNSKLAANSNGKVGVKAETFQKSSGVCSSEPFVNEPAAAMCSAFLVGEDLVATAGHCIDEASCRTQSFVFAYRMQSALEAPTEVDPSEVYRCEQVIAREQTQAQDYALVKLDRAVRNHQVLTLAKEPAQVGEAIFVAGNPSGLPTKVADGAEVRRVTPEYFVSNLNADAGTSGSPVFNAATLEVMGILVRGDVDFIFDESRQCSVSNSCSEDCHGEEATSISYIVAALRR